MKAYTYIAECADGSLYTGWTYRLKERIERHNSGRGAKYTRSRRPVVLRYYEILPDKQSAMSREYFIKRMTRKEKERLILSGEPALFEGHPCHVLKHKNEMAEASGHDEEVKNLVGAEAFVAAVENRKLQGIDYSAGGINDSPGQKPAESSGRERI